MQYVQNHSFENGSFHNTPIEEARALKAEIKVKVDENIEEHFHT